MSLLSYCLLKEMVELRKAKELNDRLDLEIRALRNRVRSLDAEKSSLQQKVSYLLDKVFYQQTLLIKSEHTGEITPLIGSFILHIYFAAQTFEFHKFAFIQLVGTTCSTFLQ